MLKKQTVMIKFLKEFGYEGSMGVLVLLGLFYILAGPIYLAKRREYYEDLAERFRTNRFCRD